MTRREIILCILAAGSGFIMMVYELVAARMLAPYVGSSTYVWTSVIGVIVAALSVGYWAGGRIADIRKEPLDVAFLFFAVAIGAIMTMQGFESTLGSIVLLDIDMRLQAVLATVLLFSPVSVMVGMISPYLAKLNVRDLQSSGRAVANLSAFNSMGGIFGTFLTGFFLFNHFGVSGIMTGLIVLSVVFAWGIEPKKYLRPRLIAMSVVVVLAILASVGQKDVKAIETASAHYVVAEEQGMDGTLRTLITSPTGRQSGVYVDNPDSLAFWYTREMADVVEQKSDVDSILMLGGGGFTLPRYLAEKYPDAMIDVVEIDPKLVEIAREDFFYDDPENVTPIAEDARTYINYNTKQYDVVLIDVFGGDSIPFTLMSSEYGDALKKAVKPGGWVVINTIAGLRGDCKVLFDATVAPYRTRFEHGEFLMRNLRQSSTNIIAVFSDNPMQLANYSSFSWGVGPIYYDDYVPAERLNTSCRDI